MAKIPLNYFRRSSYNSVDMTYDGVNKKSLYEAPFQRASVIISALVSNPDSNNVRTVTAGLSTRGTPITVASPAAVNFLTNFPIAPNDTVNIVINKLVLGQYDNLFVYETTNNGSNQLTLTLSVLETVNTQ